MSFRDLDIDLEAQNPFSDSPEFDNLIKETSNQLLDVNNNLGTLRKFVKSLESRSNLENSNKLNQKAIKSIQVTTEIFKSLSLLTRQLEKESDLSPTQIFTKDKVTSEVKSSLLSFQSLQESFTEITNSLKDEAKTALADEEIGTALESSTNPPGQPQEIILEEDVINNEEFVYQQNLIREREEEIQNIEHGIQELNELFSDLGNIVQEQGTMVDNIESNMFNVADSTKDAANELSKALKYQRRTGRTTFCLLIAFAVLLLIILLGIFL